MDGDGQKGEEGKKRIINLKNKDAYYPFTFTYQNKLIYGLDY
jgi:hypothetical protein